MKESAVTASATALPRVAFVVDYYFPATRGGGAPHAVRAALLGPGLDCAVLTTDTDQDTPGPHPTAARLKHDQGAIVRYLPPHRRRPWRLWQEVRDLGADVVVLTTPFSPRAISLLIGRLLDGRPMAPAIVIWSQGELLDYCLRQKWLKKRSFVGVARLFGLFQGVTWFVVHRDETAGAARWFGVAAEHYRCGLPPLPASAPRGPKVLGTLRLVFAGRLVWRKGVHLVLQALADIKGTVSFTIIGPEEDRRLAAECRRLAADLPANVTVKFTGSSPHSAILSGFQNHDASVLPTESESFGYSVFESLACGCVPVISRMTPFRLDDGSGIHVELTAGSIRQALQRLVDMEGNEFAVLSAASRRRAERMAADDHQASKLATRLSSLARGA